MAAGVAADAAAAAAKCAARAVFAVGRLDDRFDGCSAVDDWQWYLGERWYDDFVWQCALVEHRRAQHAKPWCRARVAGNDGGATPNARVSYVTSYDTTHAYVPFIGSSNDLIETFGTVHLLPNQFVTAQEVTIGSTTMVQATGRYIIPEDFPTPPQPGPPFTEPLNKTQCVVSWWNTSASPPNWEPPLWGAALPFIATPQSYVVTDANSAYVLNQVPQWSMAVSWYGDIVQKPITYPTTSQSSLLYYDGSYDDWKSLVPTAGQFVVGNTVNTPGSDYSLVARTLLLTDLPLPTYGVGSATYQAIVTAWNGSAFVTDWVATMPSAAWVSTITPNALLLTTTGSTYAMLAPSGPYQVLTAIR